MKPRLLTAALSIALCGFLAGALALPARAGSLSPQVISMFPQNVGEFAYADLREARSLSWFPQLKEQVLPERFRQFERFLTSAGIDPNTQVEELAWALVGSNAPSGSASPASVVPASEQIVGIALGQFRPETVELYFQAQKQPPVKIGNYSLHAFNGGTGADDLMFFFVDANTAAFGQRKQLDQLIAVRDGQTQGLPYNTELAPLINEANGSGVVWMVMSAAYTRLAMQQLAPEMEQFPQSQQLVTRLKDLTVEIIAGSGVEAHLDAVCDTPDDANTFAALLQAGLLYRRYQVGNSNPDLAAMLDQAQVAPSGDRLDIRLTLTDDQIQAMIRRNTFALHM